MFIILLVLLNVLMLFFTFSSFSDKKRIFVPLAEAISVFLCLFAGVSALMWVFEVFAVEFCLICVTVLVTALFTLVYFKSGKKGKEFFLPGEIKIDYRIFINRIVIVLAAFISLGAYSTIGIGRNDGNAQIQALAILKGQSSLEFEIEEYANIEPGSAYEFYFFNAISDIDRENFTANYRIKHVENTAETEEEEFKTEKMIGEFGSNPVYPSILALSGSIFGIKRMAFIQAIFAFCILVFVDELLLTLKCDWKLRTLLDVLLGVSPIFVYCNHTTLVEPAIGFCITMFMYFLLCKKDKFQILSVLGVITFAFLHTSVYTMLPLFLVLYWMYFAHTGKIRHIISSVIMIAGYVLSFVFLNIVAYENTAINYRLGMPFLGNKYYVFVIAVAAGTIIGGLILALIVKKIGIEKLNKFNGNTGRKIFKILMSVVALVPIPVIVAIIIIKCYTFADFLNITFIVFTVCSGVVLIPYVLFRLISTKYFTGIKEASVVVAFAYTVILYSCAMKDMLGGYYYDARYIAAFIPVIILISGMMLRLLKREEKYLIPVIGIIILVMPFTISLMDSEAETKLDYNTYETIMETVEERADENTVVFVENSLMRYFYYPLIATTDVNVYPIEPGYYEAFCNGTNDLTSKVIYITRDYVTENLSRASICYSNRMVQNRLIAEDVSFVLGLPNGFHKKEVGQIEVLELDALHRMVNYDLFEDMEMEDFDLTVKKVEITDEGLAHIIVSLTDGTNVYHNDRFMLSYHLEYDNANDVFDNPRINFGSITTDDYLVDVDLSSQPEDVTVVIDIVEEGVQWYSYDYKVPVILFTKNNNVWEYKLYYFYTKLN